MPTRRVVIRVSERQRSEKAKKGLRRTFFGVSNAMILPSERHITRS